MSLSSYGKALLVVIACALSAGVVWWGMSARIELQQSRAVTAERKLAEVELLAEQQRQALEGAQLTATELQALQQRMQQLSQSITRNAQQQSRALEELKRNDQTVSDYLAAAVPAALGSLYAREETTDPASYKTPPLVRPNAVPSASPPAVASQ